MAVTLIAHTEVGAGGAASIDFTSIPSTYDDLWLTHSIRCDFVGEYRNLLVTFNNDTATNYSNTLLEGYNAATNSYRYTSAANIRGLNSAGGTLNTSNTFASGQIYIPNYKNTSYNKQAIAEGALEKNATTEYALELGAALWRNTAAINRITLTLLSSANFVQYSQATLYGVTKA